MTARIGKNILECEFHIEGLKFEPTNVKMGGDFQKTISSQGPMISDFVTHAKDFEYNTYGIHVGKSIVSHSSVSLTKR